MLTVAQLRLLLDLLAQEVVIPPTSEFPFTVTKKAFGYSKDVERGQLQASLSIMLEAAGRRG